MNSLYASAGWAPNQAPTIISPCLRRAKVHTHRHQHMVLTMDRSGSMFEKGKAQAAHAAMLGLLAELALECNKAAFETALIGFSDQARLIHPFMPASALKANLSPPDPADSGGSTNVTAALELGRQILRDAQRQPTGQLTYVRPMVVLLSDGMHNVGDGPVPASQELKQVADILTVAFGDDADEEMLRAIATEQLAVRCRTGADLRAYFAQVGRTLTVAHTTGQASATLLANPQA